MLISNKKNTLILIGAFSFFALILGGSFAYFSTRSQGNDKASEINLKTANVNLNFVDGPEIKISNFIPGQTITKTFRVENSNNSEYKYSVVWTNVVNGFSAKEDLTYSIVCQSYSDYPNKVTSTAPCLGVTDICCPETNSTNQGIINGNSIPAGIVQEYTVTFTVDSNLSPNSISSFAGSFGIVGGNLTSNTQSCIK